MVAVQTVTAAAAREGRRVRGRGRVGLRYIVVPKYIPEIPVVRGIHSNYQCQLGFLSY